MIEVNLLKDLDDAASKSDAVKKYVSGVDMSDAIKKMFCILIWLVICVGAGKVYSVIETVNRDERQATLDSKNNEALEIENKLKMISGMSEESQKIDLQLQKIKEIFELRISPLRAIDAVRVNIPEQVFLKNLNVDNNTGSLKISGLSASSDAIKQFVSQLGSDSTFDQDQVLLDRESIGSDAIQFDISAKISGRQYAQN